MAGVERKDASTKAAKQIYESRRANQTKEILHRESACPNPSVLSYTKIKSQVVVMPPLRDIVVGFAFCVGTWSSQSSKGMTKDDCLTGSLPPPLYIRSVVV